VTVAPSTDTLAKYPRTPHLEGSRLQPGDEDASIIGFETLRGRHLVVEEKLDGSNCAISFSASGELRLQSRGHYLDGGPRERQFSLLKAWAARHRNALWQALGSRHVAYGEWLYAKHTIFYDCLPHYFLEFDVLDLRDSVFLSTERRRALLSSLPIIPVPVLRAGSFQQPEELTRLIARSRYKSSQWRQRLAATVRAEGLDAERVAAEVDPSDAMEGLYIKAEENGRVVARCKLIRESFLTAVIDSGSHWLDRPILPNQLAPGVNLFGATTP
jgi:hypothetical protein